MASSLFARADRMGSRRVTDRPQRSDRAILTDRSRRPLRSGWVASKRALIAPPSENPKSAARSLPTASMTAVTSSIRSSRVGGRSTGTGSDNPCLACRTESTERKRRVAARRPTVTAPPIPAPHSIPRPAPPSPTGRESPAFGARVRSGRRRPVTTTRCYRPGDEAGSPTHAPISQPRRARTRSSRRRVPDSQRSTPGRGVRRRLRCSRLRHTSRFVMRWRRR